MRDCRLVKPAQWLPRIKAQFLFILLSVAAPRAFGQAQPTPSPTPKIELPALISPRDFSFGFFPNGWRNNLSETSPDFLAIETGYFGFVLDVKDIARPRFGFLEDNKNYATALAEGVRRLAGRRGAGPSRKSSRRGRS